MNAGAARSGWEQNETGVFPGRSMRHVACKGRSDLSRSMVQEVGDERALSPGGKVAFSIVQ
jgi:hypothetical protein